MAAVGAACETNQGVPGPVPEVQPLYAGDKLCNMVVIVAVFQTPAIQVCLSVKDCSWRCFSRCRRRAADGHWLPSLCLVTLSHYYSIMLLAQAVI